ncbi:unnamed protein product [Nippostrongylus brasiliensis]|uniref:Uncharacterized protein n=1 Tax=Nippostrongylus brasiliensis TaxID=27835 RepID=A0A3P7BEK6_NIPBR|nr:unnamed protein product [Nippostrongylus brasiliensis]
MCFPCGIYCCLQRRQLHCTRCDCDVIKTSRDVNSSSSLGYRYQGYRTMEKGIPASLAQAYRNTAYSTSMRSASDATDGSFNSTTELFHS